MHVELAQTDICLGRVQENLENALGWVEASCADIILFPEMFLCGFDFETLSDIADLIESDVLGRLKDSCGDKIIGGSIPEMREGKLYNKFILLDRSGIIAQYRKIHLFGVEKNYFSPGKEIGFANTRFGRFGLAICYDLRFPELFRGLLLKGVEFILVCANFPSPRQMHWDALLKARAIENQFYVCGCNRVGKDQSNEYFGGSLAVDPWGDVISLGGAEEESLVFEMKKSEVHRIRKVLPVLEDICLI